MTPTSQTKYIYSVRSWCLILCWERIPCVRQCLSITPLIFCVTGFVSAKIQNVSIDLWKKILVRSSNKIVGLDLVPFSEIVVNHCCRSKNKRNYRSILLSSQNDQTGSVHLKRTEL